MRTIDYLAQDPDLLALDDIDQVRRRVRYEIPLAIADGAPVEKVLDAIDARLARYAESYWHLRAGGYTRPRSKRPVARDFFGRRTREVSEAERQRLIDQTVRPLRKGERA
ncbi:MAG: hypothetical protein LBR22_04935 [Desulfovibrio sp.]|jgi:hypothetical protein|nr:hypothetical protein [Desulfovibrio sp.]